MGLLANRLALREDASALLTELGATAVEVGMSLRSAGIERRDQTQEPSWDGETLVNRFLYAVVGSDRRVTSLRLTERWLVLETGLSCGFRVWVRLPDPVREFELKVRASRTDGVGEPRFEPDNPV